MKFSELLENSVVDKKLKWETDPTIGWFMESNPITLYYGTQQNNISAILEQGILADNSGYVTCAIEPYTAFSQGLLLTESIATQKRVVFVIEMPLEFSKKNPIVVEDGYEKLENSKLYEEWGKSDAEYYALIEAKISKLIPVNFIKGYMVRDGS